MKGFLRRIITLALVGAIFGSLALVFLLAGKIEVEVKGERLEINAYYLDKSPVASSYILDFTQCEIEFVESYTSLGTCISNVKINRLEVGEYKNDAFGLYRLYKYKKNDSVIVLKSDANVYVFNKKTKDKTKSLYQKLSKA